MAVCYERLWELLAKKNMKKIELQHRSGISGNILAKLGRNEYISMQSVEKICMLSRCSKYGQSRFRFSCFFCHE